ncbi:MAG TPA: helix-turn-helix domain-containing protein [Actinophytocola sp.]|jgi:hypothetical protein|nr:helix-turn-helix domain-containing protein [Actinophytocola sp.]
MDTFLTTADVAKRYRTPEPSVRYWRQTGYGPKCIKVGRRWLYALAEVERFERELAAAAEAAG